MSKYKISFFLEDGEEVIEETIDLINKWGYSEEEAKELIKDEIIDYLEKLKNAMEEE